MEKPPKTASRSGEALQSPNQGPARKLTALHKFIFFQRRMAGPPPAPQAPYPKADTSQLGIGGTVCLLTRHLGATHSVGAGLPFQPPADNAPPAPAGLHGPRPTQQVPALASPLVFSSAMAPRCLVRRNSQGPAQARLRWGQRRQVKGMEEHSLKGAVQTVTKELTCGVGKEGPGRQWVQMCCQLRRGADLSLVTVGLRWTLVKGFLRRREKGTITVCEGCCATSRAHGAIQDPKGPASGLSAGGQQTLLGETGRGSTCKAS